MDKATLKALRGSIKKWEKIVDGRGVDRQGLNCPLCIHFNAECNDCPVGLCAKTPYMDWINHQEDRHNVTTTNSWNKMKVLCPTCKRLAKKEVKFLKSLLPKGSGRK